MAGTGVANTSNGDRFGLAGAVEPYCKADNLVCPGYTPPRIEEHSLSKIFRSGLVAVAVLAAACGNQEPSSSTSVPLVGTSWRLVSIQGRPVLASAPVTALFADSGLSGSAGCNRYFGSATLTGARLRLGGLASTKMFCTGTGVMEQESEYLGVLSEVASYRVVGSELQLGPTETTATLVFKVE